jgi:hypothetical protein
LLEAAATVAASLPNVALETKSLGLVFFVSVCPMSLSLAPQTGDVPEV